MHDTCGTCGERNPADAAFCSQCQTYLGWDRRTTTRTEVPAPRREQAPAPAAAPAPPREETGAGSSAPQGPSPVAGSRPPTASTSSRTAADAGLHIPTESAGAPPTTPAVTASAGSTAGTVAGTGPGPGPAEARQDHPGQADPTCPECGTVNGSQRRFCRRCGHVLTVGAVDPLAAPRRGAPRPPWWRRLSRAPGATPAARRAYRRSVPVRYRATRAALVAIPLAALGGLVVLAFPEPQERAKAFVYDVLLDRTEPVAVTAATAEPPGSHSGEGWLPEYVIDGSPNAWATGWNPDAESGDACQPGRQAPAGGQPGAQAPVAGALVLQLERNAVLRKIHVKPGYTGSAAEEALPRRPRILEVRTETDCREVELADDPESQTVVVEPLRGEVVRIAVVAAYDLPQPGVDRVAITELDLAARPD